MKALPRQRALEFCSLIVRSQRPPAPLFAGVFIGARQRIDSFARTASVP